MQFHFFHLMPYAYLDLDFDKTYRASWVVLPNTYFDPVKGHELYNRYLDEMEYAEELGFDGLCVNEHHQNAYGLMPSPVVTASALARRTERATIAILGSGFNLREHPLTLAEEHAMLDCITGGRLISGMVRGIGCEYYSMGVNPAFSHERYHEAHDLVVRAWTEPGPFAFEGKHYHFEYVNMWPRPYQTPHPPIWCPSSGSFETIKWASHPDRRYVYLQTFTSFKSVARAMDSYRSLAADHGYTAKADRLGWLVAIYVADTDEGRDQRGTSTHRILVQQVPAFPAADAVATWVYIARISEAPPQQQVEHHGGDQNDRGHDGGRADHRRQPGHRAPKTHRVPNGGADRPPAVPVAVWHDAGGPDAAEHGTVHTRGHAGPGRARW